MSQSKLLNTQNIPSGGFLLLPNKLGFQELLKLEGQFSDRKMIWLCEQSSAAELDTQIMAHLDRNEIEAISFDHSDQQAQEGLSSEMRLHLESGTVVVYLSGTACTRAGSYFHVPGETLDYLTGLKLPTLPLCVHSPKETSLPQEPESLPDSILSFANLLSSPEVSTPSWQQAIFNQTEELFSKRKMLQQSLPYLLLQGLKKHGKKCAVYDGTDDSQLTYDRLLGAAIAFSKEIKESTKKKRVGIILPPGKGGLLANLAVLFAGKIPVNINFTASTGAIKSAIQQADLDKFITADPFVRKVSSFPWPPNRDLIHLERVLPLLKKNIVRWTLTAKLTPASVLATTLGIKKTGDHEEAILLFTSGSCGEPKGVPLSHRNLIANICQFASRLQLSDNAAVLGCLPLFHSFGITATTFYPILQGINLVTFPSPLDTKRHAELIERHNVELLLSTPTFLRGYMKRVKPEQLASVKLVVTGAEKLPGSIAKAFWEKFGILPHEAYGLTETSPAATLNLPDAESGTGIKISSNKFGSVGQFLQGMSVKITTLDGDKEHEINNSGIISLKGANVFSGYLNNPQKTNEALKDGWFITGDVGKVDSDGFLQIEGRISRFSKIGGEMVPHECVEEAINKTLGLEKEEERKFAIVSVPDEKKGEAIGMLSTLHEDMLEQECLSLRYKLMDDGIPSLWCPKTIFPVEEIPMLASGKLDIKTCEGIVGAFLEQRKS